MWDKSHPFVTKSCGLGSPKRTNPLGVGLGGIPNLPWTPSLYTNVTTNFTIKDLQIYTTMNVIYATSKFNNSFFMLLLFVYLRLNLTHQFVICNKIIKVSSIIYIQLWNHDLTPWTIYSHTYKCTQTRITWGQYEV